MKSATSTNVVVTQQTDETNSGGDFQSFDCCGKYHNGKEELLEIFDEYNEVKKFFDAPL